MLSAARHGMEAELHGCWAWWQRSSLATPQGRAEDPGRHRTGRIHRRTLCTSYGVCGACRNAAVQFGPQVLKDYVMGRMLLDPALDPAELIGTFVRAYYGAAAQSVRTYMQIFHNSTVATAYYMHESFDEHAPFLTPTALLESRAALQTGLVAVRGERFEPRVRAVLLAVQYVALLRWNELVEYARQHGIAWPFSPLQRAEFDVFNETAASESVLAISEGGCNLACFEKRVFPS